MAFKEISIDEIPGPNPHGRKSLALAGGILAFAESKAEACELDISENKSVKSAVSTARQYIFRNKLNVRLVVRGDRLFLVKKEDQQ